MYSLLGGFTKLSSGVENIIVSSDSQNYLDIAHKYGATDLRKDPLNLRLIPQQPIGWSTQFKYSVNLDVWDDTFNAEIFMVKRFNGLVYKSYAAKSSIVSVCLSKQNPIIIC